MSSVRFCIDPTILVANTPAETAAKEYVLSLFPEECDPMQITLEGIIKYDYNDRDYVPYGSTEALLPPTWWLDHADLTDIYAPAHTVETEVANMPTISIAEKIIPLRSIPKEHVISLERMIDRYYQKNFDDFEELVERDNGDYD